MGGLGKTIDRTTGDRAPDERSTNDRTPDGRRMAGGRAAPGTGRAQQLERLRAEIAAIEKRPMLAGRARGLRQAERAAPFLAPAGLLHEVFTDDIRNAGAALGFALGQARALLTRQRPAVVFAQLMADGQETGLPFGPGLAHFGFAPGHLVLVRTEQLTELLWAVEEAVGCPGVAAVIGDIAHPHKALDFTASRRLSLRAAGAGASVLMTRYGQTREASAAHLRWRVMPAASGPPEFDPRAPGVARFEVELEKGAIAEGRAGESWRMDWTENGFARVEIHRGRAGAAAHPAAHGALPAGLGDRLPQTG